jgi:hypothetical protein
VAMPMAVVVIRSLTGHYRPAMDSPMALMCDTQSPSRNIQKKQHGHLVGSKARCAIACIAGAHGGSPILSGSDSVFEYSRQPGQV